MAGNGEVQIGRGRDGTALSVDLRMANRHGLITGATGTGKTVTLQTLAEGFSRQGVPVFTADVKGDLSGIAKAGALTPRLDERLKKLSITDWEGRPAPTLFWDLWGKNGHPLRTTVSEMGALLLSRILDLNETQSQVLQIAFHLSDEQGLLLLDMKDLREVLSWMGENAGELKQRYGNMSPQTVATIQRNFLNLENAGGAGFFGEPALRLEHIQQKDFSGGGVVSVLDATKLLQDTRLYATFLLWLLSELFEELPEVGDLDRPKLVFFFDEAHLLFKDAPRVLVEKIEQMVRLIRSKGVGVYFVTQSPVDVPESVLGQLGNRIQHALRSYTPADQKLVRAAAQSFRPNPALDTAQAITELEVGEALISLLDSKGQPSMVERAFVLPPRGQIGPLTDAERVEVIGRSPIKGIYDQPMDRESAFELLQKRRREAASAEQARGDTRATARNDGGSVSGVLGGILFGSGRRQGIGEAMVKSVARSVGSTLGRQIVRGILGTILSGGRR